MNTVKSLQVVNYFNLSTNEFSYGVVIKFGRKKTDLKRLPLLFNTEKKAESFYDSLVPLIGQTEDVMLESPIFKAAINKHSKKASNYKPKEPVKASLEASNNTIN